MSKLPRYSLGELDVPEEVYWELYFTCRFRNQLQELLNKYRIKLNERTKKRLFESIGLEFFNDIESFLPTKTPVGTDYVK